MLTLVAEVKASFHNPVDNLNFTHSFNSSIIGCNTSLWPLVEELVLS